MPVQDRKQVSTIDFHESRGVESTPGHGVGDPIHPAEAWALHHDVAAGPISLDKLSVLGCAEIGDQFIRYRVYCPTSAVRYFVEEPA